MSSGATPPPASGGLKSVLKIAIPILALMGVIFGATLSSMYTSIPPEETGPGKPSGQEGIEPPLRFFTSTRGWDPPSYEQKYRHLPNLAPSADPSRDDRYSYNLQDRIFQGFYEPGPDTPRRAAFWFENRNPQSVTLQLEGINCGACSGGRLAAIPPATLKAYLQHTAVAALPVGTFNAFGVGLAGPAAEFDKLDWTTRKFRDDPQATYKVPAAPATPDPWAPQWGVLELTFTVSKDPKVPLLSLFRAQLDGSPVTSEHKFAIYFAPSEACAVSRSVIDAGEINQLTGDREYQFTLFSATRGPGSEFGDLAKPECVVQAAPGLDPGEFVKVTKIERVPTAELFDVAKETAQAGRITKVLAAYRITVAVRPQVGDARIPIGALDRTIHITSGTTTASVQVNARVQGAVWLATGKFEIELPTFKGRLGTVHTAELVAESAGTDLVVVEDECTPRFVKYELTKKSDRGGQGYFDLKVTVPPNRQFGALPRDAVVVLEARPKKAAGNAPAQSGQRIRIPVRGSGEQG